MTKTSNFLYDVIENYYLTNLTQNDFWLFGSRSNIEEPTVSKNTNSEVIDVLAKTVFGKKYQILDYSFAIRSVFWSQETIYQKYDDREDLTDKNFYVVVEPESETGPYEVFKCISNNYGAKSQIKPQSSESINQIGGIYNLPDGYVWKFMTSIPFSIYRKFSARGYVPIPRSAQVESIANDGIDFIEVTNPASNIGYEKLNGTVNSKSQNGVYLLDIQGTFFEATNVYKDTILYAETQEGGVEIYPILGSRRIGQKLEVTIQGDVYTDLGSNDLISIQILPQIMIRGNGTGAKAVPVFVDNRITSIRMLSNGSGYTQAEAEVITPAYFAQLDERVRSVALIRPIVSPEGGHGTNIIRELLSNAICLSGNISSTGTDITDQGTYTTLALVKNPQFTEGFLDDSFDNRLTMTLQGAEPTALLVVGDIVSQTHSGETVTGVIHEIVDGNTIKLINYDGKSSVSFDLNVQITVRGNVYNISQINTSSYEAGSGKVLYVADFLPVERTAEKTEQIKIILEF